MPKAKAKRNKYISYLLRFGVAFVALYLTFRGEDFGTIGRVLLRLNPWVVVASLGFWVLSQLVFVARWSLLLRVQSISIGFWVAFRLHLLGIFYNNCLPTSVGGDLLRAWYVTTHTEKKLEAALSVLVDRIVGLTGMVIMAFSCYWFIPVDGQKQRLEFSFNLGILERLSEYRWIFAVVGVTLVVVLIAFISNANRRNLLASGYRVFRARAAMVLQKIRNAISIYYSKKLALLLALLLTFCCQSIFILGMWLVGSQIGIDVHPKYYFVFFPIAWLLGALPISIGALGIWEGALKLMFAKVAIGVDEHLSALALYHRIIWLVGSLPGVMIHLLGAHLPKDFFVDYKKSVN